MIKNEKVKAVSPGYCKKPAVEILRYKYDPDSRLTNRWSKATGDTKYKYDPVGNLTNIDYAVSTDQKLNSRANQGMECAKKINAGVASQLRTPL